ncbi:hypothetical protein BDB01DRAFT_901830 [Pilobolus umbonatus]|nr:hypothetical protein BDB01DRAFT_901830 [Pilobolus umbonatus]
MAIVYRSQELFMGDNHSNIYQSISQGQLYEVEQCINNGQDPDTPHPITGLRPIHIAASKGYVDLVRYLYEVGCQVDATDKEEETALLKAAYAGHVSVVRYLIEVTNCNYNYQDKDGWSALHNACSAGDVELVMVLLNKEGVDVNMTSIMGHTPLMNASSRGYLEIVLLLLNERNRANPCIMNKFGETAHDVAAISGEIYLCYILEQYESIWQSSLTLNPLQIHATIPVILYEVQQQEIENDTTTSSLFLLKFLKHRNRSSVLFGKSMWIWNQQSIESKSKVELPNTAWFWLSDWRIDHSYPMLDGEGWSYSKKGNSNSNPNETYWSSEIPNDMYPGDVLLRRRRWYRVMKKISDLVPPLLTENMPEDTVQETSTDEDMQPSTAVSRYRMKRAKSQTSVSTTIPKTESIFIACSTHTQPLLEEQINNHNIRIPILHRHSNSHSNRHSNSHSNHHSNSHSNHHSNSHSNNMTINQQNVYNNVWENNNLVHQCRICDKTFNVLIRRHHCRRCGHIICDTCSTHRTLIPLSQIIQPPHVALEDLYLQSLQAQRICDLCVDNEQSNNEVSISNVNVFECPVCNKALNELTTTEEQERHIELCVSNAESDFSAIGSVRYVVYKLTDHSTLIGEECVICFEEFETDDTITRLSCMCSYHKHCINNWFSKGKECPIHSQ